nr:MAG TPA: hypothetical protein [Caudoviricetes sp.]DAJ20609.1 MAG TPA: hypothetical protein [Siphoviridae sp. ctCjJ10]
MYRPYLCVHYGTEMTGYNQRLERICTYRKGKQRKKSGGTRP